MPEQVQRSRRDHIAEVGVALFLERGFDAVTVDDIAAAAEVGRATVFRHFGDKAELVFAGDRDLEQRVLAAAGAAAAQQAPIGDDLGAALRAAGAGLRTLADHCAANPDEVTAIDTLAASDPELRARQLAKERRYADRLRELFIDHGAEPHTASLTSQLGLAIYSYARAEAGAELDRIGELMEDALLRLL